MLFFETQWACPHQLTSARGGSEREKNTGCNPGQPAASRANPRIEEVLVYLCCTRRYRCRRWPRRRPPISELTQTVGSETGSLHGILRVIWPGFHPSYPQGPLEAMGTIPALVLQLGSWGLCAVPNNICNQSVRTPPPSVHHTSDGAAN